MDKEFIINLIKNNSWQMEALKAACSLGLPDWLIGAGFVRNPVWDKLHDLNKQTAIPDIDIAYFDLSDLSEETETRYQDILNQQMPFAWSVTNQARMAEINNQSKRYISTEDAIAHWPETATAVGVRMLPDASLEIISPYGLEDLFSLKLRMTPNFGDGYDAFLSRIEKKQWLKKWPKLQII